MGLVVLNWLVTKIPENSYEEESVRKVFYPESKRSSMLTHFF